MKIKIRKWEAAVILALVLMLAGIAYAAFESITVSTAVKSLTAVTYGSANRALITVEDASIYWTFDGVTTPTTAGVGHTTAAAGWVFLDSSAKIKNFRAIRAGASDAKMKCSYWTEPY